MKIRITVLQLKEYVRVNLTNEKRITNTIKASRKVIIHRYVAQIHSIESTQYHTVHLIQITGNAVQYTVYTYSRGDGLAFARQPSTRGVG
jgi:hypothetical protein